jgi:hypothetical protein
MIESPAIKAGLFVIVATARAGYSAAMCVV